MTTTSVQRATDHAKHYADESVSDCLRYLADPDKKERSTKRYTEEIVQGVMHVMLLKLSTIHWNNTQRQWDWHSRVSFQAGPISVEVTDGFDAFGVISALDVQVGSWVDGKHPFYRSYFTNDDWTDNEFIAWAKKVFAVMDTLYSNTPIIPLTNKESDPDPFL